jgi:hypothetical protein
MASAKKKIKDLQSLEKEIRRLRQQAKNMEKELDDNIIYLQQNYSSLIINSLMPDTTRVKGIPGTILQLLLQHERLRETLTSLAEHAVDKAADGLELLSNKLLGKK